MCSFGVLLPDCVLAHSQGRANDAQRLRQRLQEVYGGGGRARAEEPPGEKKDQQIGSVTGASRTDKCRLTLQNSEEMDYFNIQNS